VPTYNLNVNTPGIVHRLNIALTRARMMAVYGLTASNAFDGDLPADLPGESLPMRMQGEGGWDDADAKEQFHHWVLTNSLRDAVESIGTAFEEARTVSAIYALVREEGKTTLADYHRQVIGRQTSYHRLGLPQKISRLENLTDGAVVPTWREELLSINAARNCLVHRNGRVGQKDCNNGNVLTVSWYRLGIVAIAPDGAECEIGVGAVVEGGSKVAIKNLAATRDFAIGERVAFGVDEFSQICGTLFFFGGDIVEKVRKYGEALGVPTGGSSEGAEE